MKRRAMKTTVKILGRSVWPIVRHVLALAGFASFAAAVMSKQTSRSKTDVQSKADPAGGRQ